MGRGKLGQKSRRAFNAEVTEDTESGEDGLGI
jgi:hypothetical protein